VPGGGGSYFAYFASDSKAFEFGCKVKGPTIRHARSGAAYR